MKRQTKPTRTDINRDSRRIRDSWTATERNRRREEAEHRQNQLWAILGLAPVPVRAAS
ncbi:MAG: hypothetical protein QGG36_07775 [Pirellulaceae bacterium]|jgi:hypothetical protein|nr:hypothetical protein [Pirellulaceae bacterium]MDP7015683.1 hypothetical protein [Pirellulaceae bacterium]